MFTLWFRLKLPTFAHARQFQFEMKYFQTVKFERDSLNEILSVILWDLWDKLFSKINSSYFPE